MATQAFPDLQTADFAETPRRQVGRALVPLPAYQFEALTAQRRIKVYKWCRQAGKDWIASLEASLDALTTGRPWYIVSLTERQALATFDKVKIHLRAWGIVLGDLAFADEVIRYRGANGDWCQVTAKKVTLPGGGSISALPGADPDAIAGLTGNVIFTEMALFPHNGVEHWRVVFPLITRGYRIVAISTPRGHDTKFADMCRNAAGKYWVSVCDIHRAIADGVKFRDDEGRVTTAAELEKLYADPAGWQREYLCKESDEIDALIAWKWMELAKADYQATRLTIGSIEDYNPAVQNVFQELRGRGAHFLGWDVARKGHLSSVWVNQLVGDVYWLRAMLNMDRMDFDYQSQVLRQGMDACSRGAGDATGMGMESCERLGKRYPGRFDEVNFNSGKPMIGSKLMTFYEDVRQRIPAKGFDDVIHDLHGVQKETKLGRLILHETQNPLEKRSHCDMAYANGLALFAATDAVSGPIECIVGEPCAAAELRTAGGTRAKWGWES